MGGCPNATQHVQNRCYGQVRAHKKEGIDDEPLEEGATGGPTNASEEERLRMDMRMGVLFQQGALFSSLTVLENIQVPMREYLDLPQSLMDELAYLKIEMVGLAADAADKIELLRAPGLPDQHARPGGDARLGAGHDRLPRPRRAPRARRP